MNGSGYSWWVLNAHESEEKQISLDNLFDKMILFLALFQCMSND